MLGQSKDIQPCITLYKAGLCLLCNQRGAVYGYDIATIREGNTLDGSKRSAVIAVKHLAQLGRSPLERGKALAPAKVH